jgi:hypothetical protein
MEVEEWPQVDYTKQVLFNRNKDYEYDKKGLSDTNAKGVMPYAKRESR